MIQFPLYEALKRELKGGRALVIEQPGKSVRDGMAPIVTAAALSKLVASSVTYPHEVIRSRLQFDRSSEMYSGMLDAVRKTYMIDGLPGFWQVSYESSPQPSDVRVDASLTFLRRATLSILPAQSPSASSPSSPMSGSRGSCKSDFDPNTPHCEWV